MNGSGFPIARRYRLLLLLFCGTMLYFFANVQRVAIPGSVFSLLQEELRISAPYVTGLGSAFMYVYALNQLSSVFWWTVTGEDGSSWRERFCSVRGRCCFRSRAR